MFHSSRSLVSKVAAATSMKRSTAILSFPRRNEGTYPWFDSLSQKLPNENRILEHEKYVDETEVQTRMSQVIHKFRILDLHKLDWNSSFEQLGLDIYEQNALLTSIEHEFHTVFEDRLFESFETFNEV